MKSLNAPCSSRNPAHTAQYRSSQAPCRCRRLPAASAVAPAAATAGTAAGSPEESYAAVQQLVADRALDPDPALVAQEAHLTLSYLSSQPGALPQDLQHAAQLADHALRLTDLMATGSTFRTLQMLKRHPALLHLSAHEVANRVLQLKLMMPAADVSRLLYQKPTLLLIDDLPGVVGAALNKLHALMPGIPVEAKLHEGGTVFWSFSSLLQDNSSSSRRAAPTATTSSSTRNSGTQGVSHSQQEQQQQQQQQYGRSSLCPSSPDARLSGQQC